MASGSGTSGLGGGSSRSGRSGVGKTPARSGIPAKSQVRPPVKPASATRPVQNPIARKSPLPKPAPPPNPVPHPKPLALPPSVPLPPRGPGGVWGAAKKVAIDTRDSLARGVDGGGGAMAAGFLDKTRDVFAPKPLMTEAIGGRRNPNRSTLAYFSDGGRNQGERVAQNLHQKWTGKPLPPGGATVTSPTGARVEFRPMATSTQGGGAQIVRTLQEAARNRSGSFVALGQQEYQGAQTLLEVPNRNIARGPVNPVERGIKSVGDAARLGLNRLGAGTPAEGPVPIRSTLEGWSKKLKIPLSPNAGTDLCGTTNTAAGSTHKVHGFVHVLKGGDVPTQTAHVEGVLNEARLEARALGKNNLGGSAPAAPPPASRILPEPVKTLGRIGGAGLNFLGALGSTALAARGAGEMVYGDTTSDKAMGAVDLAAGSSGLLASGLTAGGQTLRGVGALPFAGVAGGLLGAKQMSETVQRDGEALLGFRVADPERWITGGVKTLGGIAMIAGGPVTAGVGVVGAIGAEVYDNWNEIGAFADKSWEASKSAGRSVLDTGSSMFSWARQKVGWDD